MMTVQQVVTATIVGWVRRQDFIAQCSTFDFGYGPRVAVPQTQLSPIGVNVDVTGEQVADLAQRRNGNKRKHGVADRACSTIGSEAIDEDGIVGEIAVASWLGVDIDRDVYVGADRGFDLTSARGSTIDVKTTRKPRGRLFFNDTASFKADIAVLVVIKR